MSSPYDPFAWFYNRYWAEPFQDWQAPVLDRLMPGPCRALDLCCGTGQLARRLLARGYQVTGVDSSAGMLRFARDNAEAASFLLADASEFQLPEPVEAAICVFDSLNHVLEERRIAGALERVYDSLVPGGVFLCDINTDAAYGPQWDGTGSAVEPDHAFFLRGHYDPLHRRGTTKITMFRLQERWERFDVEVLQRPWRVEEMKSMLAAAGFSEIESFLPLEDLGIGGHYGTGRVYIRSCRKSLPAALP